ncbi:MAG: TetR/AcrR family transcriptional regulator [Spirochaetaceae bacterium]|jgi:AcrR family transcriptional regulator|nr:TetR/AcrR family transcriptional regulator [Spirochaetaceae bacterium]
MTKTEIIQAAFKVWGEALYRTTSLSKLSASLNVTKAALYHHFKNKENLLEAMYDAYFDSVSDCLRPCIAETLKRAESGADFHGLLEAYLRINTEITGFFANNPWYFTFSLIKVYGNKKLKPDASERMRERGVDFEKMLRIEKSVNSENSYPSLFHLIFSASICMMAYLLRAMYIKGETESAGAEITEKIDDFVRRGIGFDSEKIQAMNWEALEKAAAWRENSGGGGGRRKLIEAAASVIAAVGPWSASMSMIAEKSGLSKSGLYAHFKSKQDILYQLFEGELEEAIRHARTAVGKSDIPEEQLYLAIRALESFLTSRPEFLSAISKLKTRGFDFGRKDCPTEDMREHHEKHQKIMGRIFSGIKNASGKALIDETMTLVILFILTDTLIQKPAFMDYKSIPDESFRTLYKFIALGIEYARF